VASGKVDLNKTVKEIGLDDVQPFLPVEESATLLNLLTARSAIYHPSGNPSLTDLSPRRGSMYPGLYFQYQNWDFNAAGTAFEKLTGQDLYAALESDLAGPLGMQDFDRKKQRKNSSMPDSVHPEYAMYLSTRDLARLGLLMSRDGMWNGTRILPEGWASRITTLVTPADQIHPLMPGIGAGLATMDHWGYGMLWWVWDVPKGVEIGPFHGAYTAMGANGQYITVFPEDDVVVVHKVDIDTDESNEVKPVEYTATLALGVAAECSEECK
jgi:CubicO group peptidase (beta-lactamase class C family)